MLRRDFLLAAFEKLRKHDIIENNFKVLEKAKKSGEKFSWLHHTEKFEQPQASACFAHNLFLS